MFDSIFRRTRCLCVMFNNRTSSRMSPVRPFNKLCGLWPQFKNLSNMPSSSKSFRSYIHMMKVLIRHFFNDSINLHLSATNHNFFPLLFTHASIIDFVDNIKNVVNELSEGRSANTFKTTTKNFNSFTTILALHAKYYFFF